MINIELKGAERVLLKIKNLETAIKDMKPAFEEIGNYIIKDAQENMESTNTRRNFGGAWAALAESTLKARAKGYGYYNSGGGGTKPLIWTGRLRGGFKKTDTKNYMVEVGNSVEYYPFHQLGGRILPKRQMLGIEKNMIGNILQIMNKHIRKALNKNV